MTPWVIDNVQEPHLLKSSEFQGRDLGWTLRSIVSFAVNINKYNPMQGSSYIKMPSDIQKKTRFFECLNIDDQYFKYAVLSTLHLVERSKINPVDCPITSNTRVS